MKHQDPIWATMVNLSGLWGLEPVRCYWNKQLRSWWDRSGEFDVKKLGLIKEDNITYFSSRNKKEVQIFIQGVLALYDRVKNMA